MTNTSFCEKMRAAFSRKSISAELFLYDEIDSTNNEALRRAKEGDVKDTFFIAKSQSGGRGRRGRSFLSNEGGLYLSYLFKPRKEASDALLMTVFAAVALISALEEVIKQPRKSSG